MVCGLRRCVLKSPDTSNAPGARSKQAFMFNGGSGTHVDAPAHFIPGGRTIDALQPHELVGVPLAVVDVMDACAQDADHAVSQAEIEADEARHGRILPNSLVCMRTGWSSKYRAACELVRHEREQQEGNQQQQEPLQILGLSSAGVSSFDEITWTAYHGIRRADDVHPDYNLSRMHFPGLSPDAALWLVQSRSIAGLGIDTLSPDPGASEGFKVHHAILGANRYIVENLNLEGLPARGATVVVAPLAIRDAPEAPARVFVSWSQSPQPVDRRHCP